MFQYSATGAAVNLTSGGSFGTPLSHRRPPRRSVPRRSTSRAADSMTVTLDMTDAPACRTPRSTWHRSSPATSAPTSASSPPARFLHRGTAYGDRACLISGEKLGQDALTNETRGVIEGQVAIGGDKRPAVDIAYRAGYLAGQHRRHLRPHRDPSTAPRCSRRARENARSSSRRRVSARLSGNPQRRNSEDSSSPAMRRRTASQLRRRVGPDPALRWPNATRQRRGSYMQVRYAGYILPPTASERLHVARGLG